jgi:hypothetical protein
MELNKSVEACVEAALDLLAKIRGACFLLLSLIFNQIQKVRFPLQTSINKVAMQE